MRPPLPLSPLSQRGRAASKRSWRPRLFFFLKQRRGLRTKCTSVSLPTELCDSSRRLTALTGPLQPQKPTAPPGWPYWTPPRTRRAPASPASTPTWPARGWRPPSACRGWRPCWTGGLSAHGCGGRSVSRAAGRQCCVPAVLCACWSPAHGVTLPIAFQWTLSRATRFLAAKISTSRARMSGTKLRSERPFTSGKRCRRWDGAKADLNLYTFTGDFLCNVQLVCCWKVSLPGRISSSRGWERQAATRRVPTEARCRFSPGQHTWAGGSCHGAQTQLSAAAHAASAAQHSTSLTCTAQPLVGAQSECEVVPFCSCYWLTDKAKMTLYPENPHCVKNKQAHRLICK